MRGASANVRVVNPFPVDLDARAEVNQQQDTVDSMTLSFLFLFTRWDPCQRILCLEEDHSYRGKIASLLTAILLRGYSMTLLNTSIITLCFVCSFMFSKVVRKLCLEIPYQLQACAYISFLRINGFTQEIKIFNF